MAEREVIDIDDEMSEVQLSVTGSPPPPYRADQPTVTTIGSTDGAAASLAEASTEASNTSTSQGNRRAEPVDEEHTVESVNMAPFLARLRMLSDYARAQFITWATGDVTPVSAASSSTPAKRTASDAGLDEDIDLGLDSDDDDNATDEVAPYNPSQQIRPKLPIYHPGYTLAHNLSKSVLHIIQDFLKATSKTRYNDSEVNELWNKTIRISKPVSEAIIRIAVTGDTGTGKSATINSILGVDNLTPEGDSGGAVTNVVTEFRKRLPNQNSPITAVIVFFSIEMCEKMVNDWYSDFYEITNKDEDELDDQEKARKDAAFECLEALFTDHFASSEDFAKFLATPKSSSKDTVILRKLQLWTVQLRQKLIKEGDSSIELVDFAHDKMREQLRPFRGTAQNARFDNQKLTCSPWPFVEIIQYHFDNDVLEDNCLADVPGARDVNMFRVKTANEYLQNCDKTVIVGEIKRICSDESFRQHYMDAHRRRYHGSVILIATKSDEMNDDGGSNLRLDTLAEDLLTPIEDELEKLKAKLEGIDERVEHHKDALKRKLSMRPCLSAAIDTDETTMLTADQHKAQIYSLRAYKKSIPQNIATLEHRRRQIRIDCRNRQVQMGMDQNYRRDTRDDGGAVTFCLSNRMFMRHVRGYDRKNPERIPSMTLEETQVVKACNYFYSIPSQGKFAVLEHFVLYTIPAHLDVVAMSCAKTTEARIAYITKKVDHTVETVEARIQKLFNEFRALWTTKLVEELSSHELQDSFDRNSKRRLAEWKQLSAATHRAVCRKNGSSIQKKKGGEKIEHYWNDALLATVKSDVDKAFRMMLDKACADFKAETAQKIKQAFNELNKELKDDPQALAGDAYNLCFGKRLADHERNITYQVERATKVLMEGINALRRKATRAEEDGDYLYEAMCHIYIAALSAKASKGQTMFIARHKELEKGIVGCDGVFKAISDWTKEDIAELVDKVEDQLKDGITGVFKEIKASFEKEKRRKANDSPEGQLFRKNLHLLVDESRKVLEGVAKESLMKCKDFK